MGLTPVTLRHMRRKEKEITEKQEIVSIVQKNKVLRLGLTNGQLPYIVPLNYGFEYKEGHFIFYMHGAKEGMKMDMMKENNQVCIEIDCSHRLIEAETACAYGYAFESVIGFGKVTCLECSEVKREALDRIMEQQTGAKERFEFPEEALKNTCVYQVEIEEITGKRKLIQE